MTKYDGVDPRDRGLDDNTSDAELMSRLDDPAGDALTMLIRRYRRLVFGIAVKILRDAGEAEDVTQEVFLEVYCRSSLYDASKGTVRVWMTQYAHHRALRRKAALRLRVAYRGESLDDARHPVGQAPRPLSAAECGWVLKAGFEHLPERQRATLEMICAEDLTLKEVACRLQVSLGSARHYYYRGIDRLRAWAASS